ncbi:MAG: YiiX/YebB-like N1pC/P60 family cysteine hydrolase [Arcobacter sp.]|jgi:ribosomal protein S24E|uniref:YiiX/YebB-like N1pC/P60 family cysteine hydrolase n=1 Tax=Arcobacter sp. TaxID=1872629 RepID=UPI002586A9A6|nr:YiiX/YebB-like N1pC/P60 family cysteine hydrolase [Arcobacter sp.]MDD3009147.1 YiiX/YebB-like N1pC/P60 family cysteine hydrolase [Arcobacter sp.]MDY3203925.1 YiiX/YebB-like N1pC/P60 family cysteine hydrolase [Arcobacter sp.]
MLKKIICLIFINYVYLFSIDFDSYKSGDIIFRKENSFLSDIFSNIDTFDYSHGGILKKEDNQFYVYHMERTNSNEKDLKKDEISKFLSKSERYSIIRLKQKFSEDRLFFILKNYENMKDLKFDIQFLLNNGDNNLYCSEFIYIVYKKLIDINIYSYLYEIIGKKGITLRSIYTNESIFEKIQ